MLEFGVHLVGAAAAAVAAAERAAMYFGADSSTQVCDIAAGEGEAGWVDRDDPAWVDSVPSPKYEWDAGAEPLPTTGNWGEWNSYMASDPEFPISGEGIPFRVDDDDLFLDEEVSSKYCSS